VRVLEGHQATPCSVSQALDRAMVEARQGYRAPVVFGSQFAATSADTAQEEPAVYVAEEKLKARYIGCKACCCQRLLQLHEIHAVCRAARFGTGFQPVPEEPAAQPASKAKAVKQDFSHGLDLLSQV